MWAAETVPMPRCCELAEESRPAPLQAVQLTDSPSEWVEVDYGHLELGAMMMTS